MFINNPTYRTAQRDRLLAIGRGFEWRAAHTALARQLNSEQKAALGPDWVHLIGQGSYPGLVRLPWVTTVIIADDPGIHEAVVELIALQLESASVQHAGRFSRLDGSIAAGPARKLTVIDNPDDGVLAPLLTRAAKPPADQLLVLLCPGSSHELIDIPSVRGSVNFVLFRAKSDDRKKSIAGIPAFLLASLAHDTTFIVSARGRRLFNVRLPIGERETEGAGG